VSASPYDFEDKWNVTSGLSCAVVQTFPLEHFYDITLEMEDIEEDSLNVYSHFCFLARKVLQKISK